MSTLRIFPEGDLSVNESFAQLGVAGINTLVLSPGVYRTDGIAAPRPASEDVEFDIALEDGAWIDFGAITWADMHSPAGGYRNLVLPPGYTISGSGVCGLRNAGMMAIRTDGDLLLDGITIRAICALGVQETSLSEGQIAVRDCTFEDIGIDPAPDDPVWGWVRRVPDGAILNGGGLDYDIWEAVRLAQMEHLILNVADGPEITNEHAFLQERTVMYLLCKQLGWHGEGLKALYLAEGAGYQILNNVFQNVSGSAVSMKRCGHVLIKENTATECSSFYQVHFDCPSVVVQGNSVLTRRMTQGLGPARGFTLSSPTVPTHEGNRWGFEQDPDVFAYQVWDDAPVPDLSSDIFTSNDFAPVPIFGGGARLVTPPPVDPVEPPIPPDPPDVARPVVEIRPETMAADLARLHTFVGEPVVARFFPEMYEIRALFDGFVDLEIDLGGMRLENVTCREVTSDDKGPRWEGNVGSLSAFTLKGGGRVRIKGEALIAECLSRGFMFETVVDLDWSEATFTVRDCAYSAMGYFDCPDMRGGIVDAEGCNALGRHGWDSLNKATRMPHASWKKVRSCRHYGAAFWLDYRCPGFRIDELDVCDNTSYGFVPEFSEGGWVGLLRAYGNQKAAMGLRAMEGLTIDRIEAGANAGALIRVEGGSPEARLDRVDGEIRICHSQGLTIKSGTMTAPGDGPEGLWRNDMGGPSFDEGPVFAGVPAEFEPVPHEKQTYFQFFKDSSQVSGVTQTLASAEYEEQPFEVPEKWRPYLVSDPLPGEPPVEPLSECTCAEDIRALRDEIVALRAGSMALEMDLAELAGSVDAVHEKLDRLLDGGRVVYN